MNNYLFTVYDSVFYKGIIQKTQRNLDILYGTGHNQDQSSRLHEIITHAKENTTYYRKRINSIDINEIPVLTKEIVKQEFDSLISSSFSRGRNFYGFTSGSTGSPMKYCLDNAKKKRRMAEMIYFNGWAGFYLGQRHVLNSIGSRKSKFSRLLQNQIIIDPSKVNKVFLNEFRNILINRKIKFYVAYPSVLDEIADFCLNKGDESSHFCLEGIIATGEPLSAHTRKLAESVFGCEVLSRYSALEFGVLAQQCPEAHTFHLNTLNYYFEVMKMNSDMPAEEGEVGRLIITDLNNLAMPFIRYEIGDLAVIKESDCPCGRKGFVIDSLQGRIVDSLFDTAGNLISFAFLNTLMWPFHEQIIRYQFIQISTNKIDLLIQSSKEFNSYSELEDKLHNVFGKDMDLSVSIVDSIPPFASGKKPFVINKLLRKN